MPAGVPFASDENYYKFIEADAASKVEVRDDRALVVDPLPAMLSAATPPTFTFRPAMMAERTGPVRRWLGRLAAGVGLVPRALAHCRPSWRELLPAPDQRRRSQGPRVHRGPLGDVVHSRRGDLVEGDVEAVRARPGHPVARHLPQRQRQRGPFVATRAVSVKVGP